MPFGLEDDELSAHIDLYERRQQRINKIKLQSRSASKLQAASKPEFTPSGHTAKSSPPPPYRAKHIEDIKAKAVDSKTIPNVNETATFGITHQEQPPPYSATSSSSTRQCLWNKRLFGPRAEASVPPVHITSHATGPTRITTRRVSSSLKYETSVPSRRQPAAQDQGNTPALQAAGVTAQLDTR